MRACVYKNKTTQIIILPNLHAKVLVWVAIRLKPYTSLPEKLVVQASHCCSKKGKPPAGWMDIYNVKKDIR